MLRIGGPRRLIALASERRLADIRLTLRLRRVFEISSSLLRRTGFAGLLAANFTLGLAYAFVLPYISMWGTLEVGMPSRVVGSWCDLRSAVA